MDINAMAKRIASGMSDLHIEIQDKLEALCVKMGCELSEDTIGNLATEVFDKIGEDAANLSEMEDAAFEKIAKPMISEKIKDIQGDQSKALVEINEWFKTHYRINFDLSLAGEIGKFGPPKKLKVEVDPKNVGILALVFKSAEVVCRMGSFLHGEKIWFMVSFEFSWEHQRGSNGYSVRMTFDDTGKFRDMA